MLLWHGVYAAAVTLSASHVNLISGGGLLKVAAAWTPGATAVNRPPLLTLTCADGVDRRPLLREVSTPPRL